MSDNEQKQTLPITQLSLVDDIPPYQVKRPTDGEIIELLAITYEASEDTVTRWLVDLVKGLEQ